MNITALKRSLKHSLKQVVHAFNIMNIKNRWKSLDKERENFGIDFQKNQTSTSPYKEDNDSFKFGIWFLQLCHRLALDLKNCNKELLLRDEIYQEHLYSSDTSCLTAAALKEKVGLKLAEEHVEAFALPLPFDLDL